MSENLTNLCSGSEIEWHLKFRQFWTVFRWSPYYFFAGHQLDCYNCGLNSTNGECDNFTPQNETYLVTCNPVKYQSCLTTTGKFGDVVGKKLSMKSSCYRLCRLDSCVSVKMNKTMFCEEMNKTSSKVANAPTSIHK
jgi:hypothetical protein